ncbi:MAG: phosphatidylglycerol lysyltransferase domain-containing protein [Maritimibacter sp.]
MANQNTRDLSAAKTLQSQFDLRKILIRQMPPLAIFAVLGVVLWDRIQTLDMAHVFAALQTVGPGQWALGLVLTGVSFWSLGQYDVLVHRLLGLGTPPVEASRTGITAIAVSQTVGMGAITGSFVRWRMLPNVSLFDATRISAVVALSFLAAWAVVSALAVLAFGVPLPGARLVATVVLIGAAAVIGLSLWRAGPIGRLPLPSLKAMGMIFVFTLIDTVAAGGVLWAMLPDGLTIAPAQLITAYLLALGAGLVLTTPGGVGPFEVALIALLPGLPSEPVLAAVIAYRALYYVLPALIGAALLIRGPAPRAARLTLPLPKLEPVKAPYLPFLLDAVLDAAPRAEAALLRHGRFNLLSDRNNRPTALAAPSAQTLIMLGDPLRRDAQGDVVLADLTSRARAALLAPALYKCGGRLATAARRAGWATLPVSREAWIDAQRYSEAGSARRQLRRKLRKAESANMTLRSIAPTDPTPLPLQAMEALANEWATERGGERGFSMGIWAPDTLAWSRIYLAEDGTGALIGFITVHATPNEHTLDLMRASKDAPDGTMHLLVHYAIEAAKTAGVARFSLAAVPLSDAANEPALFAKLRNHLDGVTGAGGLRQFKSAFGPNWETLYFAAPTKAALLLAAVDILREITRPPKARS